MQEDLNAWAERLQQLAADFVALQNAGAEDLDDFFSELVLQDSTGNLEELSAYLHHGCEYVPEDDPLDPN